MIQAFYPVEASPTNEPCPNIVKWTAADPEEELGSKPFTQPTRKPLPTKERNRRRASRKQKKESQRQNRA